MWTGEFDLNTLRVGGKIVESGTKKLQIQNYPDSCERGERMIALNYKKSETNITAAEGSTFKLPHLNHLLASR